LIVEEVAKVYPELVVKGTDGKPQTVAYHLLPAMLLNELQTQARELDEKDERIAALQKGVDAMKRKITQVDALAARLDAIERNARASSPELLAATMR
jgi:hypothetical protein